MDYNHELYHFGVPGMKWGKRKAQYAAGNLRLQKYRSKWDDTANKHNVTQASANLKSINKVNALRAEGDRKGARAEKKTHKLDTTIRVHETNKKLNKQTFDYAAQEAKTKRAESGDRFGKMKDRKLKNQLNNIAKQQKNTETVNNYQIAKAKGKKDPKYKETAEYKKSMSEGRKLYGKAYAAMAVATALYVGAAVAVSSSN